MYKGLGSGRACRSRFVCNTSSPIQSPWNASARRRCRRAVLAVRAVPVVPVMQSGTTCPGGTHTCPCPNPARNAIPSASGQQTSNAPRTGPMGTRQREPLRPAWTVDVFRPPDASYFAFPPSPPGRIAAGQCSDHGCLGYTPCRAAAGTPRANTSLSLRRKSGRTYANAIRF